MTTPPMTTTTEPLKTETTLGSLSQVAIYGTRHFITFSCQNMKLIIKDKKKCRRQIPLRQQVLTDERCSSALYL